MGTLRRTTLWLAAALAPLASVPESRADDAPPAAEGARGPWQPREAGPSAPPPCAPQRACDLPPMAPPAIAPEKTWTVFPRGRVWHAVPDGDFLYITLGGEPGTATRVKTDDDLDLEAALSWEAGVDVSHRRHRMRASYESLHFEGENVLDEAIVFHGDLYPAGTEVDSELDLGFWKASWDYRLTGGPGHGVRAGLSAWIWTFDSSVEGGPAGKSTRGFTHVYPLATVEAETRLGRVSLGASFAGGILADDRYVLDVGAYAGLRIGSWARFEVGYRYLRFAFHETTNEADLAFHGPYAEFSVDF